MIAPSRTGGIRHFWRPNPGYAHENDDWVEAGTVGTGCYDEVSVVRLGDDDRPVDLSQAPPVFDSTAPLWLVAR